MSQVSIRNARNLDTEVLLGLEQACLPDPWGQASVETALGDEKYLVLILEAEQQSIGYLIGWNVSDEAEIARIGVLAQWRGQGLGKMLLVRALEDFKAREVKDVFLDVRVGNTAARRLYESCGFATIVERRNYYSDGGDALVMKHEIAIN